MFFLCSRQRRAAIPAIVSVGVDELHSVLDVLPESGGAAPPRAVKVPKPQFSRSRMDPRTGKLKSVSLDLIGTPGYSEERNGSRPRPQASSSERDQLFSDKFNSPLEHMRMLDRRLD